MILIIFDRRSLGRLRGIGDMRSFITIVDDQFEPCSRSFREATTWM
jgi:hypothetical protein